jgi:hypothetical protein
MRTRRDIVIFIWVAALTGRLQAAYSQESQSDRFGPRVKSFLELMQVEENELDYQIKHNEISRREYTRSRNRIAVTRQTVVNIARETGEDRVPELHVLVAAEIDQIVENGLSALKGVKAGAIIEGKLRYIGTVTRGEAFYVFERLEQR